MKLPQPNLEPVNRNRRNEGKQQAKTGGVTPSFLPDWVVDTGIEVGTSVLCKKFGICL